MTSTVIAIDDEPHNLELLAEYFEKTPYALKCFPAAQAALDYLRSGGAADVVLLDRMMPGHDGMSFMRMFKSLERCGGTPVIMQTAAAGSSEISEGIQAGVYYYLTKPFARDVLLAVVARALADSAFHNGMTQSAKDIAAVMSRLDDVRISFRTMDDIRAISLFVAKLFPNPDEAVLGVTELMINAVEHGNLGISYSEKCALMLHGGWHREVERRLALPQNAAKWARLHLQRDHTQVVLTIEDSGEGFDWTQYVAFDRGRARHSHGRGIAMARLVSFDEITYVAPGNKVICRKQCVDAPS